MRNRIMVGVLAGTLAVVSACAEDPTTLEAADVAASAAQAGEGGARDRSLLGRLLAMREELGLSDAQVGQVRAIAEQLEAKNRPLREQLRAASGRQGIDREALAGLSPEERRAKVRELREARRRELAQMSEAEREALRAELRAKREALRPVMAELRANTRAALEQVRSVLTDEQEARIREAMRDHRARARERGDGDRAWRRGPGRAG